MIGNWTPQGSTWDYMGVGETEIPDAWVWERLRVRRNALLAASDFRMVIDAPWDTEPWAAYRQALRDLTDTDNPRTVAWPVQPS